MSWGSLNWVAANYGNPEEALLAPEQEVETRLRWADDVMEILPLLCPRDRVIWQLRCEGRSQEETAAQVGIKQPSVCTREKSIREWAMRVIPLRKKLKGLEHPRLSYREWDVYYRIVWCNQSLALAARQIRIKQSTVSITWTRLKEKIAAGKDRELAEIVAVISKKIYKWVAPRGPVELDSPLEIPAHPYGLSPWPNMKTGKSIEGVVAPKKPMQKTNEIDTEVNRFVAEIDKDLTAWKKKNKCQYRVGEYATSGLVRSSLEKDVRCIYYRHFSRRAEAAGLDHTETLQSLYLGFLIRDNLKGRFDPSRASWPTYAYLVISSVLNNLMRAARLRRSRDQYAVPVTEEYDESQETAVLAADQDPTGKGFLDLLAETEVAAHELGGKLGREYYRYRVYGESCPKMSGKVKLEFRKKLRVALVG